MNILLLTNENLNNNFNISKQMENNSDCKITVIYKKINLDLVKEYDFIISFGYRYIIKKDVINHFQKKIINCHISYLPYNRGSDPNLWSLLTDTPSGITIHLLTEKLDQGDIIYQEEINLSEDDTLASSYNILINNMIELILKHFNNLINCNFTVKPQDHSKHTYYELKDRPDFNIICPNSWDTKRKEVKELYIKHFCPIHPI
jgi:methionyl-tRNA formyltransferase